MIDINHILENKERVVRYDFSGIYFLICKDKVIYVGKASYSIEDRLNTHRSRKRMKFDSIYAIRADRNEIDQLEKLYIEKYTPKFNFIDNPIATDNDRYTCFSLIHNKYTSMNKLSEEIGINASTLRAVIDPTIELDEYQKSIFEKVKDHLLNKYHKYRKPKSTQKMNPGKK